MVIVFMWGRAKVATENQYCPTSTTFFYAAFGGIITSGQILACSARYVLIVYCYTLPLGNLLSLYLSCFLVRKRHIEEEGQSERRVEGEETKRAIFGFTGEEGQSEQCIEVEEAGGGGVN